MKLHRRQSPVQKKTHGPNAAAGAHDSEEERSLEYFIPQTRHRLSHLSAAGKPHLMLPPARRGKKLMKLLPLIFPIVSLLHPRSSTPARIIITLATHPDQENDTKCKPHEILGERTSVVKLPCPTTQSRQRPCEPEHPCIGSTKNSNPRRRKTEKLASPPTSSNSPAANPHRLAKEAPKPTNWKGNPAAWRTQLPGEHKRSIPIAREWTRSLKPSSPRKGRPPVPPATPTATRRGPDPKEAKKRRQNPKATTSPRRATMPSSSERSCRSFIRRREGRATIAGNLSSTVKVDGEQTLGLDYKKSTLYTAGNRIPRLPSLSGTDTVAGEAGSRRDRPRRRSPLFSPPLSTLASRREWKGRKPHCEPASA